MVTLEYARAYVDEMHRLASLTQPRPSARRAPRRALRRLLGR